MHPLTRLERLGAYGGAISYMRHKALEVKDYRDA
jgi:hypothetical protein